MISKIAIIAVQFDRISSTLLQALQRPGDLDGLSSSACRRKLLVKSQAYPNEIASSPPDENVCQSFWRVCLYRGRQPAYLSS